MMDMPLSFSVKPLSPLCGAEIIGVDLSQELPQQTVDSIQEAWNKHVVLIFRGQDLTEEQQLRFASRFGELGKRKKPPEKLQSLVTGSEQITPEVMLVSNKKVDGQPVGAFGDGEMWFHIDSGYAESPYAYTFLYGVELPSWGGNTRFANTIAAYDALPQEIKTNLRGKSALHIHEYERRQRVPLRDDISHSPHWIHPICIEHPKSGRTALFVDRLMTRRIEGVPLDESEEMLDFLYNHVEREEFVFEHEWSLGDVVMWDNLATVHGRTYFPETETRLLRRCTIEGKPLRMAR
ncbi:MAG: TauD/TfdA family dioxygenase [Rhodospirillaceae bacterium]|jgi:taurine dioxygenase